MSKKLPLSAPALCAAAMLLGGCAKSEQAPVTQGREPVAVAAVLPRALTLAGPALKAGSVEQLLHVGDSKYILPRYKTRLERQLERRFQDARVHALSLADPYETYRQNNYDKFFITKPPTSTSFRPVAEYEPSQAYLLNWEQSSQTAWKTMFGAVVKGAWGVVPALMVYNHAAHKAWLEQELVNLGYSATEIKDPKNVIWWKHETDSIWLRDSGPIGILSVPTSGTGIVSFVDFRYYPTRVYDDELPTDLGADWGVNVFRPDLNFEGGNFMNTSDGLCVMSKSVLFENPQLAQSAVEDVFKKYVGCKKLALPAPLSGEGTGHVDMYAKLGSDTALLVGEYTATQDAANKAILDANATLLGGTQTPTGKTITVTRIPMPNKGGTATSHVWRTYANALALNGGTKKVILIPTYSDEQSQESTALAAFTTVFPGWTQVKVDSKVIIPGNGATHCVAMQIPSGQKAKMEADPADLCGATKIQCVSGACGNITAKGCCEGDVLKYCTSGKLYADDCSSSPKCGWDTTSGAYECGTTGGTDPQGTYAKSCGVLTDAPVPDLGPDAGKACGNVGYEGCCDGETLWYCDSDQLEYINCAAEGSPKCGWNATDGYYDCSTAGSADPSNSYPKECSKVFGDGGPPPTDGMADLKPKGDQGPGSCGKVSYEGCCDGEKLKFCQNGKLYSLDCTSNPKCGWNSSSGYYDCSTGGTADPSGKHPLSCGALASDGRIADGLTLDRALSEPRPLDQSLIDRGPDAGPGTQDDGCSCAVAAEPHAGRAGLWLGVVLVGAWVARRRRR